MKTCLILMLSVMLVNTASAQKNYDSTAYENQRTKINDLLTQRKQKFGQYDSSLSMHTGIFGLQTKKDIKKSNEILMDVVNTDNIIFNELKVLLSYRNNQLDYRTYQQQQAQSHSKDVETMSQGFMHTINRLRDQNEQLKQAVEKATREADHDRIRYIVVIVLMAASILYLLIRKRSIKA